MVKFKKRLFTKLELDEIALCIKEKEALFTGQIVVVSVKKSAPYQEFSLSFGIFGQVFFSLCYLFLSLDYYSVFSLSSVFLLQFSFFILFYLLGKTDFVLRVFLPRTYINLRVKKHALEAFTENSLHHTKNENGVLIFLSELERQVEILCDRGSYKILGEPFLKSEASKIVKGIREKKGSHAICNTISTVTSILKPHFPKEEVSANELSDEVRLD